MRYGTAPAKSLKTKCCTGVRGETWGNGAAAEGSKTTVTSELVALSTSDGRTIVIATGIRFATR